MSVIVGLVRDDTIHMAADSFLGNNNNRSRSRIPKLWRFGEALIGFSGSGSAMNAVRFRMTMPEHAEDETDEHYMTVKFVDALREAVGAAGRRKKENDLESAKTWLLVGYRGLLWRVYDDFCVAAYDRDYDAVGAGEDFAYGVLHALKDSDRSPKDVLTAALDAACEHSPYCIAPYVYEDSP